MVEAGREGGGGVGGGVGDGAGKRGVVREVEVFRLMEAIEE